jgi:hypothetical protein
MVRKEFVLEGIQKTDGGYMLQLVAPDETRTFGPLKLETVETLHIGEELAIQSEMSSEELEEFRQARAAWTLHKN